jgi:subtilisin family serine protease
MRRSFKFSLILLLLLVTASSAFAGRYSTAFPVYLSEHQNDVMVTAIVTMADQVDLRSLQDGLYAIHADRQLWHETVVRALQAKATETQADLMSFLSDQASLGNVEKYTGLWVGNVVIISAKPEVFDRIAAREDVDMVSPDYAISNTQPVSRGGDEPSIAGHEIGLERVAADQCWAMGITGDGRLVSSLDTGVQGDHPAFADRWAGLDPQYSGHPEWAWFDPVTNTDFPFDSGQHGTHTMGTICGRSTTTADTVGIAIDAHWISCGVIDRGGIGPTVTNALLSFQWIVDPDGNPSTVWDVPDVNSNSWGVTTGHGYPDCDETFWTVLDGCEAAGIVVVFAAGNEGPGATTLRRPADRATTDLTSFSVAAVDGNDPDLPIADFSSRGPSYCTPDGNETFKPEISAPGVNVRSSVPGNGYQGGWSGTSMATPHIAGIVALMRQANPNLTSEQVRQILLDTATDLGPEGEDNSYGMGIANAYEAVLRALAYLDGWGTLAGVVTDQASGTPIQGAHISVNGRPWGANTRANGSYALFVPADTAWTIKIEHPPLHLPMFDTVTVVENDTLIQNYALEGKVTVTLKASFGNPVDASYRSFFIKGSWDSDGFYNAGWTAPAIEIKDNGIAPDQTANDGIFTGTALLARDLVHTYQWALYTENYGGEASRLQNGANFTIPTLTPPTVATLSVNPSGSDHNWGISMYANGGAVTLDLTRGVNGRPTKWGSAIALTGGVQYNVRFRVMHSAIASYGAGGVGGADISYTPPVDGSYDFIFDDRDDSYVIQLTGTEGPPTYLSVRSGLDGHLPVSWLSPGTVESQQLSYDDGALANATYYYAYDNLMGTMFEPTGATVIDSVIFHFLIEGDPYWPWPDGSTDAVGISIFLDDGSGMPDADPAWYGEATAEPGQELRVDVPEIEAPGNFWVMFNNLDGGGEEGIGLDLATDYPANKWTREGGAWGTWDVYAGDFMVRAKVFGGTRDGWMGYDASPAAPIPANVPIHSNPALAAGSGTASKAMSATQNHNIDRLAYHPNASRVNPPTITDTQVLAGYNLYRGTSTNPYNGGASNRVNSSLILVTNYDDWGTDANGPIVNGTLYYYQAGAVYDIGGGQFVEVGPSNEGTGTAVNHPPAAPQNLTGTTLGNTITLNWNANTDYDIASYRVYRRDYNAQNFNLVGTITHPTTTFSEVLNIDGIYRYKVAAVDNGTPQLQSEGFSNSVDLPIGAIPPRDASASTDQEFQITVKWKHPGGGGGGGTVLVVAADDASMFISELQAYEDIELVDYYDARNGTPSIDELEPYAAVVLWSNYPLSDPTGMGNVMADYVDNGGTVIMAQFCFGSGWGLEGRIMDEYSPFSQGPTQYQFRNLGEYDPSDPLMEGVTEVSDLYLASVSMVNNGTLVASWDDGTPFVAYNPDLPVIGINAYVGDDRQFTGDMITIFHNAINAGGGAEVIPQNYKLFKATSVGGPYNLLATLPGTQKTYVDAPVPNAVDYWYRLTAVYPGPDESDPTNIAQGRAMNYPPTAPFALAGIVDARNINLHWSFTDTKGDWQHFNVYKKIVPGGTWTLAGTTTDSSFTVVIPGGQDGVYSIAVTAVDDGSPQLESVQSNAPFFPVGNLPVTNLRATTSQEGVVPLRWNQPGVRPTTTLSYDDGALVNAYYFYAYENIMAEMFDVNGSAEIETLWVHVLTEGDPYWPWPDGSADPVGISIFDDDGSGNPGDQVFYQEATVEPGEWIMVPIEGGVTVEGPNFWVGMQNIDGGGDEGIGLDLATDYPANKWTFLNGVWGTSDDYAGDHMIRATIIDNGRSLLLHENAPSRELAQNSAPASFGDAAVSVAVPGKISMPSLTGFNDGNIQQPFDTEVMLGYNIYRALAPNVPVDPGHRLRDYNAQGLSTAYNDSAVVNGTTYYYKVTAVYDNNSVIEESPASNEVSATPVMGGRMVLNPLFFNAVAMPGQVVSANLNIANPGGLPINYSIFASTNNRTVNNRHSNPFTIDAGYQSRQQPADKSNLPAEPHNPPVLLGRGGPDDFGYIWIDSDEPGGPAYDWEDITDVGEQLPMSGDDQNIGPYDLGFDFPYYGELFNSIQICSNGWISPTSTSTVYYNGQLPDPNAPSNMIAALWDDLYFPSGGECWFYSDATHAVVSYIGVPHISGYGPYTFQIILSANGAITYNYDTTYPEYDATIGIQNGDGSIGLMVAYNAGYVHDEMSVRFVASWLSADPSAGVVSIGGNTNVNIIFDATFLGLGTYTGTCVVTGTDQNHQVAQVSMPVTFHVVTDAVDEPSEILPSEFSLAQNFPNPFNPTTGIDFALPTKSHVTLEVFNVLGQKVKVLVNSDMEPGYKSVIWDGTNIAGASVTSGTYFYILKAGDKTFTKKMTMLK